MATNSFRGLQTKSGANGYGIGYVPPPATLPTMYTAGNGNALTQYPTGGQVPYGLGQGQVMSPSAGYMDRMKKLSNETFGTTFNPSASGQYDTTGMTADAEGNFYSNPSDAIKMNANMNGMPNATSTGITAGDIASGLGAAANLANAYIGYKNYGLAKDKFGFEKAATNRSIENQAIEFNAGVQNRGDVGLAIAGDRLSPEQRAAEQARMQGQMISGAKIG